MYDRNAHSRSWSWSLSVWTRFVALAFVALLTSGTTTGGVLVVTPEDGGALMRSDDVAELDAPAESPAILVTCYPWQNLYKRRLLILKEWGHRLSVPCADRFGCLDNAEWKHGSNVNAPGPEHSWIEGGKAQDIHGECG